MEIEESGRSAHELMMGRPADAKQRAYNELVSYYRHHGWTHDDSSDSIDVFEPPASATPEEIAEINRGAETIMATFGLGVL
ncbi:hypothetical protein [Mycolicibacterium grossiae]|nr:hypothetical protein [Mycolicibacterium grossiae]